MPGIPALPNSSAYSDQPNAASVPNEMSVSMVAAPCRRFAQAARWNGQAPQITTGPASASEIHCQYSNCSAGTMASTITGSASTADPSSRSRSGRVGSGSGGPVVGVTAAGLGRVAV